MRRLLDVAVVAVVVLDTVVLAVVAVLLLPLYVGSVPVPLGALVAAVANVVAVLALGRVTSRTSVVALPLGAWVLTVLGTASPGPGGDTLLVGDWRALLLLGAGLVPAALLLGRHLGAGAAAAARDRPGGARPPAVGGAQSAR